MNIDRTGPSFKTATPDTAPALGSSTAVSSAARIASVAASAPAGGQHAAAAQLSSTHADFDAAKVAAIRASINAGHYQVNTHHLADGLLASVRELLQGPRS